MPRILGCRQTSVPLADPSAPFSAGETEYREMREEKKDSAIRSRRTETNFATRLSSGVLSKPQGPGQYIFLAFDRFK